MMNEMSKYDVAVHAIKTAILQSQYDAARSVNEKQLTLYYGVGKFISLNSRKGFWGKGAIDAISERLQRELPGLRGFSARSLRDMRIFYEEWSMFDAPQVADGRLVLADASAKTYDGESNPDLLRSKITEDSNLAVAIAKIAGRHAGETPQDRAQSHNSTIPQ
jgi:hypothetical protein